MITLHTAIYSLNPAIISINELTAYDVNGHVVQYDLAAAQVKLVELQAAESQAEQAAAAHKASAVSKLTALGLTQDEINALIG